MDEHLRELERAMIEDPNLEPYYLSTLIKAGHLNPYYVACAAYLGHKPAENLVEDAIITAWPSDPDTLDNKLNTVISRLSFYLCASLIIKCFEYTTEGFEEISEAIPLLKQLIDSDEEDEKLIQRLTTLANLVADAEYEYFLHGWHRKNDMQRIFPQEVENIISYWRTFTFKTTEEHAKNRLNYFRVITRDVLYEFRDLGESFANDIGYRPEKRVGWTMALEYQIDKLIKLLLTPEIHLRRNPDQAPIIVIGMRPAYEWQMRHIIDDLDELGWDNLLQQMLDKNYEVYDMATQPEKGDARNHIQEDTPLIIAMHLFGIDPHDQYKFYPSGYYYNKNNYMIYKLAEMWNIPLMAIGEQPEPDCCSGTHIVHRAPINKNTLSRQYFTDKAN